jgi:hypothetical protein
MKTNCCSFVVAPAGVIAEQLKHSIAVVTVEATIATAI